MIPVTLTAPMSYCEPGLNLEFKFVNICPGAYMYKHTHVLQEYEEGVTPEAIVVKDLDKFDMIFKAFEYETGEIMCVCFYIFLQVFSFYY